VYYIIISNAQYTENCLEGGNSILFWLLLPFNNFDGNVPCCATYYKSNHHVNPSADAQDRRSRKGSGETKGLPEAKVSKRRLFILAKDDSVECFKGWKIETLVIPNFYGWNLWIF